MRVRVRAYAHAFVCKSPAPSPGADPGIEENVDFRDMDGLVVVNVEFNRLCRRKHL